MNIAILLLLIIILKKLSAPEHLYNMPLWEMETYKATNKLRLKAAGCFS